VVNLGVTCPTALPASTSQTLLADNVAPTLTAPLANQGFTQGIAANASLGSFSDPGSVDGPWAVSVNWGDSTSSSFTASTPGALSQGHAFANAGTFQVTVTVTDKDGASNSTSTMVKVSQPLAPGDYIVTPFEKIPNFGAPPTVVSNRSGNW